MNQGSDSSQEISNSQSDEDIYFNPKQKMGQIKNKMSMKSQKEKKNCLPLSLLKDIDTDEEEESEEEQDVVLPDNMHEFDGLNFKDGNIASWENRMFSRKLKSPNKKNKEKFYSFDDIQNQKQFQFQKNKMMMQQRAQQQQLYYANQQQHFSFSNFNQPQSFYQPQVSQFPMYPQMYNGNFAMNPFMGMNQQMPIKGGVTDMDMISKQKKNQMGFGEKILSNPKRMLSSPVTCLQTHQKKKKDKKKVANDEFQTLDKLIKQTNGDLFSLIITQNGSREIQKLLYKISPADIIILVENLSQHFSDLMIDKYANYFCQKLIQNCSPELRIQILKSIKDRFIEISCNSFGTHSLQTLIEIANMPSEQEVLRQCIETDVLSLAIDGKGTHVLQKFIACSHENQQGDIPETLLDNFNKLINDSHGVCVLIKFVNNSTNQTLKERLVSLITKNALEIIQNPFGNYVVQSLLKESDTSLCKDILQVICDNFSSLSMQKFSSNVVERTITLIDEETLKKLTNEVITSGKLESMLKNTYGNFVIEKMITKMSKEDRMLISQEMIKLGKEKGITTSITNLLSQ